MITLTKAQEKHLATKHKAEQALWHLRFATANFREWVEFTRFKQIQEGGCDRAMYAQHLARIIATATKAQQTLKTL